MKKFTPADNAKIGLLMMIFGSLTTEPGSGLLSFSGIVDVLWFLVSFLVFASGMRHWDSEPFTKKWFRKNADRDAPSGSGR